MPLAWYFAECGVDWKILTQSVKLANNRNSVIQVLFHAHLIISLTVTSWKTCVRLVWSKCEARTIYFYKYQFMQHVFDTVFTVWNKKSKLVNFKLTKYYFLPVIAALSSALTTALSLNHAELQWKKLFGLQIKSLHRQVM